MYSNKLVLDLAILFLLVYVFIACFFALQIEIRKNNMPCQIIYIYIATACNVLLRLTI